MIRDRQKLPGRSFRQVLKKELREVGKSRGRRSATACGISTERDPVRRAARSNLVGLAFSGGGIRSATFNLGVLQGLARFNLLRRVDYLSTVSGGGYIGSWFTSWVKASGLGAVQEALAGTGAGTSPANPPESAGSKDCGTPSVEPPQVRHLRQYSNYLTPQVGFLSADTWTMIAIYVRNLSLNLTVLALTLAGLLLVPQIAFRASGRLEELPVPFLGTVFVILGLIILILSAVNHNRLSQFGRTNAASKRINEHQDGDGAKPASKWNKRFTSQTAVQLGIVMPMFFAAWIGTAITRRWGSVPGLEWVVGAMALLLAICVSVVIGLLRDKYKGDLTWKLATRSALPRIVFLPLTGIAAVWLVRSVSPFLQDGINWRAVANIYPLPPEAWWVVWGVPLMIGCFAVAGTFYIGLMGRNFSTGQREWWARLGAWIGIYVVVWIGVFGIALGDGRTAAGALSGWAKGFLASGWLLTTIAGLLAGKSDSTGGKNSSRWMELLGTVAPYVFVAGLLVAINEFTKATVLAGPPLGMWQVSLRLAALIAAAGFLSWRFDINEFSLHNFYRNRLVRCYIGASDKKRDAHPFTGFDESEHSLRISDLVGEPEEDPENAPRQIKFAANGHVYDGPYHIVNTTLNLVEGDELAWQKRKGQSFTFTPMYSGFGDCFRPTARYDGGLSLGTAIAISGAAASPNMGYHSSKALAFLMTVFNVRLGWWLGNPRVAKHWKKCGPLFGLGYLLFELFGLANKKRNFVYLSDGGHFENLGIYELVKRRCRFIIACDGSQDGSAAGYTFEDLGNAIEKCRTDLGVNIEIDVGQIKQPPGGGYSEWHCAVGRIHYGGSDESESQGTLLYLKATLTGDEPADVLRYAALNKEFPHQTTGDQWFDESQFESYRALGFHIVETVIGPVYEAADETVAHTESFITKLRQHWFPEASTGSGTFTRHSAALQGIWETLRTSDDLKFLDPQVYPEWQKLLNGKAEFPKNVFWKPPNAKEIRAGFYLCSRIIQLMENVYLDLDLEREYEHPDNRGWMNFFRHWSWAGMLRVTWTITASTYGARFQNFCRRRLDLDIGRVTVGGGIELPGESSEQIRKLDEIEGAAKLNFYEKHLILLLIRHDDGNRRDAAGLERVLHRVQIEVDLPGNSKRMSFPVGFAWIQAGKLRFFRIQDHLRTMGLGRLALQGFLARHKKCELDTADFPDDPAFPNEQERKKFQNLYDGIRADLELHDSQQVPPPQGGAAGANGGRSPDSDKTANGQGGDSTEDGPS